ncbi:hypothetical protein ACSBR2_002330 [Camellia fascicularis]
MLFYPLLQLCVWIAKIVKSGALIQYLVFLFLLYILTTHFFLALILRIKCSDFLLKIGILDSNTSLLCHLCSSELETASYVLLHCPFSWSIWSAVVEEWGLHWCIPNSVDGLLSWWMSGKFHNFDRSIWKAIPLIVLWSIWKLRNECMFSNAQPNSSGLLKLIKFRAAVWLKASIKDFPFSVDDLVFNWRQITDGVG